MSDVEVLSAAAKKTAKSLKRRRPTSKQQESSSDESSSGGSEDEQQQQQQQQLRRQRRRAQNDEQQREAKSAEEMNLESLVFGAEFTVIGDGRKNKSVVVDEANKKTVKSELADNFVQRKPAWQDDDDQVEKQMSRKTAALYSKHFGTPIWADLEQQKSKKKKKSLSAKKKARKLLKTASASNGSTAQSSDDEESGEEEDEDDDDDDDDDDDEEEDNMFQQTGNFLASKKSSSRAPLPPNIIDIKACVDANFEEPQHARIKAVEFHPNARVVLTGGLNQKLSLFQVDGKKNPKIQSVFIDKFPILAAHFTRTGDEIVLSSRHKSFYYYDMIAGKMVNVFPPVRAIDENKQSRLGSDFEISPDNRFLAFLGAYGQIHLFSVKSKEYVDSMKISGSCTAVAFSSDARYLFAYGDDNAVNVFDLAHRGYECMHKFNDFGALSGTSLAVSSNSQFLATGCKSGVVNLYKLDDCLLNPQGSTMTTMSTVAAQRNPKPLKTFMNLTTPCTSLKFNPTSELLAIASSYTENACKLIHLSSMSVFSNFPSKQQQMGKFSMQQQQSSSNPPIRIPECIDFSPNSGYFTIGNHKGNARLFRLKHYACY